MLDEDLIRVAAALDSGNSKAALEALCELTLQPSSRSHRHLIVSLWRHTLQLAPEQGVIEGEAAHGGLQFLDICDTGLRTNNLWVIFRACAAAGDALGSERLAGLLLSVLWDELPYAHYAIQYEVFARASIAGDAGRLRTLWWHILAEDPAFVPDYWLYQGLARAVAQSGRRDIELVMANLLEAAARDDLAPLMEVYQLILRQKDIPAGFRRARDLTDPVHRQRMASYLLGASQCDANLPGAVALHDELAGPEEKDERDYMQARLAVLRKEWDRVLVLTGPLAAHSGQAHQAHQAICLRALALAQTGDAEEAGNAIDHILFSKSAAWFLKGRATLLKVSRRLLSEGLALPNDCPAERVAVRAGRPLAQALWVGPRLRWIEEMSIRSFLLNGWRYQLYVYDIPENVPDGVEIMDASAILPRSTLFSESGGSGMHAGSLGAFSDLFRYALLERRGGMWTDTDVINLDRFEPDGDRFVSTEFNDAGLVTVNGAMMAAPAGDPMLRMARERSEQILGTEELHFTRIGPQLLAELLGDVGMQGYRLMPTHFLNPIGWMETGTLLARYDEVVERPRLRDATNIHVYTETWRTVGLGLSAPPEDKDSFLGTLYDRFMNADPASGVDVRTLIRH